MNPAIPLGQFVWFDLMTSDPEAAKSFYTQLLGWGIEMWDGGPEPYSMWTLNGVPLGGCVQLPEEVAAAGAPPHWLSYVSTPDVDATIAKAVELGGAQLMAPMDLPEVGRFSVLADPQGAALAAFTPANEPPAGAGKSEVGRVSWHELLTTDYQAALGFYSELFGWQKSEAIDMGEAGIYQMYGLSAEAPIGGMMNKPPEMPVAAWLYYIQVADLDAAIEQTKALGGQLVNGPMEVPGGDRVAQCMDPQGAAFALHGRASAG